MTCSFLLRSVKILWLSGFLCLMAQPHPEGKDDLAAVLSTASAGIAAVGQIETTGSGVPVVLLEELHGSRAAQIQEAILFVRLYSKYGLRVIALSGYLKERPKSNARWFTDRGQDQTLFE